jgi:hypothetical protein
LVALALAERRVVTLLESTGESGGPFLITAALQTPGKPVLGVAVIREIPIVRMNAVLLRRLSSFLDWTASCIRSARESSDADLAEPPGEGALLPRSFMLFSLELALRQARESGFGMGFLLFRIGDYQALSPVDRPRVMKTVEGILSGSIRSYDSLCDSGGLGEFAVLFVQPRADAAAAILDRVRLALREAKASGLPVPAQILSGFQFVPPAPDSVEALIAEAKKVMVPLEW